MATLKTKIVFQYQLSLNACQKYCRMLQGEYSALLWTFIKLPFDIKIFVLSVFEWPFYSGFTVCRLPPTVGGHKEKQLAQFLFYVIE